MAEQPVPNTAQVRMYYRQVGQTETFMNVYHVTNSGGIGEGDLLAIGNAFIGWETTEMQPLRPLDIEFYRVNVTDLTSMEGEIYDTTLAAPIVGEHASPSLPGNASMAVKWNIGRRGRGRSGRTFHIGIPESEAVGDVVDADYSTNLVAGYNELVTIIEALGTSQLAIVHRREAGAQLPEGVPFPVTGAVLVDRTIDSQKLRLRNHRRQKRTQTP